MRSMDPESTVVQEVARSCERGVGGAPPRPPALCLKSQQAYIRMQGIHRADMLNLDTVTIVNQAPTQEPAVPAGGRLVRG